MTPGELRTNRELEDAVAEDPYDEDRWSILEDWILEVETDPRAEIILLEKAGALAAAEQARDRLLAELLGAEHEALARTLYARRWRAGYLRECHIAGGPLAELARARATSLLRALTITGVAEAHGPQLAAAGFARALRRLTLSNVDGFAGNVRMVDAEHVAALPRLAHVEMRGVFAVGAPLPQVRSAVLAFTSYTHEHVGPILAQVRFAALDQLVIDVRAPRVEPADLEASLSRAALAPLVRGEVVPALRTLVISGAPAPVVRHALDALASSPWARQLVELSLGSTPRPVESLAPRYGRAFAHLQAVSLPADFR